MRINIGKISLEDADELITLQCNLQSLLTLQKINTNIIDPSDIESKIIHYKNLFDTRWMNVYNKYNIPNHLGEIIKIDYETGILYYNE